MQPSLAIPRLPSMLTLRLCTGWVPCCIKHYWTYALLLCVFVLWYCPISSNEGIAERKHLQKMYGLDWCAPFGAALWLCTSMHLISSRHRTHAIGEAYGGLAGCRAQPAAPQHNSMSTYCACVLCHFSQFVLWWPGQPALQGQQGPGGEAGHGRSKGPQTSSNEQPLCSTMGHPGMSG